MALGLENAKNQHTPPYIVPPATELTSSSNSQAACFKELFLRLKEGKKKKKFCRDGKTDKQSVISYSGDEIMGLIERDKMVLVPAAITPLGHTSRLFKKILYEYDTEPHRIFRDRPNTNICEESAQSTKVRHNILGRANSIYVASFTPL